MQMYKKYVRMCPETRKCSKFYLRVRKNPTINTWYCDQPYGVNKLKNTIIEICKEAGFTGKFTNHSLRATCASRMYDRDIPEQIIKEVTGHKSEAVRVYKRMSDHLRETASRTLGEVDLEKKQKECENKVVEQTGDSNEVELLSVDKMIENVNKTKAEMRKKLYQKS